MSFNENKGYIYIISTLLYNSGKSIKIGSTRNYEKRYFNYKTYSHIPWEYIKVYEILDNNCNNCYEIDNLIQKEFENDLINNPDSGVEWYNNSNNLIERVEKYLQNNFNINEVKRDKLDYKNFETYKKLEKIDKEGKINMINNFVMEEIQFKKKIKILKDNGYIKRSLFCSVTHYEDPQKNGIYYRECIEDDEGFKDKMDTLRRYQYNCVFTLIHILLEYEAVYLELATGAGKTFITYNIFKYMNPKTIIIFSPLKKINNQNVSNKYLKIIGLNKYKIYKYSDKSKLKGFNTNEYNIIVCCSQSSDKLYNTLKKKNILKNDLELFVWYDEAHWGFEEWLNEENNDKYVSSDSRKFWLENTEIIKYRLFVSASPNKKLVNENLNIFGSLYNPISYKELQDQGWVCPIIPKCFDCFIDKPLVNMSNFIINTFKDNNRNWGFSFHSEQVNAFNLFYEHYLKYKNEDTNIKPFLLIGDDFYKQFEYKYIEKLKKKINDTINIDKKDKLQNELDNILKLKIKTIEVEKYFENKYNHKDYETYEKQQYSIAYVVKQYSMGYDFKGIDYIIFPDTKTSYKDIIQSIGRGTRSDQLGEGGRNRNKELYFFIPVYFEDNCNINKEIKTRSEKNLIAVLSYLIYSYGMDVYEFAKNTLYKNKDKNQTRDKELPIDGNEDVQDKFLDLLYQYDLIKQIKLKKLIQLLKVNKIYNETEYNTYITSNKKYRLKNNVHDYKDFCWQLVVDPSHTRYHKDKELCEQSKKNIFKINQINLSNDDYDDFYDNYKNEGWVELNKYNSKIPPYRNLDKFYP